jgi:hypothetical protein
MEMNESLIRSLIDQFSKKGDIRVKMNNGTVIHARWNDTHGLYFNVEQGNAVDDIEQPEGTEGDSEGTSLA